MNITDGSHNPPAGVDSSQYMMLSSKNIIGGEITFDQARFLTSSDFYKENARSYFQDLDSWHIPQDPPEAVMALSENSFLYNN